MTSSMKVKTEIYDEIMKLLEGNNIIISDEMPLIGGSSVLDSMKLVELCLLLEDKASEMGFDFDWTSDAAMSQSRSMFRTAGSLALEFINQMESKR